MGARPWSPSAELEGAPDRGALRYAVALAEELRIDHGKPIPLGLAARFLPLVAQQSPREYDTWARRWLVRWLAEHEAASIGQAAEITAMLAELPKQRAAASTIDSLL